MGKPCRGSKDRSPTPSTNADSEDLDGSALSLREDSMQAVDHVLIAVKKGLEGEWLGDEGESYWIEEGPDSTQWACALPHGTASRKIILFYDKRCGVIWWGNRGDYFLDVKDISTNPDKITWTPFDC